MVAGLDVVSRLAEHQRNLHPPAGSHDVALLALPTPPICRALAADAFAHRRAQALAELAIEIGGGAGAAPVVDLDHGGTWPALRDDLAARGIRELVVYGAHDQPGFWRSLLLSWPGPLRKVDGARGSMLSWLLAESPPVLPLTDGVVRTAPGVPVPANARVALVALTADDDPHAVLGSGVEVLPFAHDPQRTTGAWTGFVPRAACWGSARGEAIRSRWRSWWEARGFGDAVRQAVLGLDPALEAWLRSETSGERSPVRAKVFVVTGMDGAGKSTHAERLRQCLASAGHTACTLKIYRQGAFLELADELSGRTRHGAPLQSFRVSRVVKLIDSLRTYRDAFAPAAASHDALVMDRYVETHVAAAEAQLGWDVRGHPLLAVFPAATHTTWLRLPFERALERLQQRDERLSADEHEVGLAGYAQAFDELAGDGDLVLDAGAPLADNAERIAAQVLPRLGAPRQSATAPAAVPAAARAGAKPGARCRVVVGRGDDRPVLGADVFALRTLLHETIGAAADGVEPRLWLEAWAAQVLLDLRTLAPERACLPVWPPALAGALSGDDLLGLHELGARIAAAVEVEGVDLETMPLVGELGSASGAIRLEHAYLAALRRAAAEAGWRATSTRARP